MGRSTRNIVSLRIHRVLTFLYNIPGKWEYDRGKLRQGHEYDRGTLRLRANWWRTSPPPPHTGGTRRHTLPVDVSGRYLVALDGVDQLFVEAGHYFERLVADRLVLAGGAPLGRRVPQLKVITLQRGQLTLQVLQLGERLVVLPAVTLSHRREGLQTCRVRFPAGVSSYGAVCSVTIGWVRVGDTGIPRHPVRSATRTTALTGLQRSCGIVPL